MENLEKMSSQETFENIFSGNLIDLKNNSSLKLDGNSLKIELPAYGYKFFKLY